MYLNEKSQKEIRKLPMMMITIAITYTMHKACCKRPTETLKSHKKFADITDLLVSVSTLQKKERKNSDTKQIHKKHK